MGMDWGAQAQVAFRTPREGTTVWPLATEQTANRPQVQLHTQKTAGLGTKTFTPLLQGMMDPSPDARRRAKGIEAFRSIRIWRPRITTPSRRHPLPPL